MHFSFNVGIKETHEIGISFNPIWGFLRIEVDHKPVKRVWLLFSVQLIETFRIGVGDKEVHVVDFEIERKLFFAGFRKKFYRALVDNKLVKEYEGL